MAHDIIEILIQAAREKEDPAIINVFTQQSNSGRTALHYAVLNSSTFLEEFLKKNHTHIKDFEAKDRYQNTPLSLLYLSCERRKKTALLKKYILKRQEETSHIPA
jgi:ankyrin repeat protein